MKSAVIKPDWLRNDSQYTGYDILEAANFVVRTLDFDPDNVAIQVEPIRLGRARGECCAPHSYYFVHIQMAAPNQYPLNSVSLGAVFADWREALVFMLAHEFSHVEEFRKGQPQSEDTCNRRAAEVLTAWRNFMANREAARASIAEDVAKREIAEKITAEDLAAMRTE